MSGMPLKDAMKDWASNVFGLAKMYNIHLDYTEESVDKIEELTEIIHKEIKSNSNVKHENIDKVTKIIGSFLGEVIIINLGGKWEVNENKSIIIKFNNQSECSPFGKIYKRLNNGKEDDIEFYYKVLKENISRGDFL